MPIASSVRRVYEIRIFASGDATSTGTIPKYTNADPLAGRLSYNQTLQQKKYVLSDIKWNNP
jgi:hypothetical protein